MLDPCDEKDAFRRLTINRPVLSLVFSMEWRSVAGLFMLRLIAIKIIVYIRAYSSYIFSSYVASHNAEYS